ncbi:hypothetical protein [uncultured Methanobrevibacter sp.]|uniref:hypothetical protein n=1 Tax=uncultured Methanobrevibacter sp. TaxID=253161 RepID=UPI00261EB8E1|nr:hypothetical protein [uncultured Methanobrevibacter sp.]
MSVYRTITVGAQLSGNKITADADVGGNINADAQMVNRMEINNVSDYNLLNNKPQINSVTLEGDKSFDDLGLEGISNLELEEILR